MHIKMKRLGNLKNGRQWLKLSTGGGICWGVMEGKGSCKVKLSTGGGICWGARKERAVVMSSLQMTLTLYPVSC